MKNSYLTAGITLKQLVRLLGENPVSCHPRYLLRIFFLLQSAGWSSLFSIIESKRYENKLKETVNIPDPVFIIGHWRTGTTFLHKLMSMDPGFIAPTLFHVAVPDGFLASYRFYRPVMNLMVSRHRPMDMMKMGIDEPQEDEYAIYRMTRFSPLTSLIFPRGPGYFLSKAGSYLPEEKALPEWENAYRVFFKKLYILSGKRVISKNPFNSMRIPELRRMFPGAKFIHIYRDPLSVIPSTRNMFQIVQKQNTLNGNVAPLSLEEICGVYDAFMTRLQQDFRDIPRDQRHEIRFEDLERDTPGTMEALYTALRFDFSEQFRQRLLDYLNEVRDYRKNEFHLSDDEKKIIAGMLKDQMKYYHYI